MKNFTLVKKVCFGIMGLLLITGINTTVSGQLQNGFESFDNFPFNDDSVYDTTGGGSAEGDVIILSLVEKADAYEGEGAASLEYTVAADQTWGGQTAYTLLALPGTTWDWTGDTILSIYFNNTFAQTLTGRAHFRIELYDAHDTTPDVLGAGTEVWYSFEYILDTDLGWTNLSIPLKDVGAAAQTAPGGNGFQLTGWFGVTKNSVLDLDKIRGITFEIAQSSPQDNLENAGTILLDNLQLIGSSTTSVKNNMLYQNDLVYPNPANDFVHFKNNMDITSVEVINLTGQVVIKLTGQNINSLDLTSLTSGIYSLKIYSAGGNFYSQKLIKE